MKAAQRLLECAARDGVRICFANPGTSEMHLVAALDAVPQIHPVLCLFEGVATGAADGYGRMTQAPALTLLHLGPGLANLHNAYRARTPIVSLIGEHATYHRANNPPLATDIEALARPVSVWLRTVEQPETLVTLTAEALRAARQAGPAALILPADVAWSDIEPRSPSSAPNVKAEDETWPDQIDQAAKTLGANTVLMLGGRLLTTRACAAAQSIADKTGAKVFVETFPARIERGAGRSRLTRLPYLTEMAAGLLTGADTLVLAGASYPVAFFALPERPTRLAPSNVQTLQLVQPGANPEAALGALAEAVGAPRATSLPAPELAVAITDARLDPLAFAQTIAATLPANAIVSDDAVRPSRCSANGGD